MGAALVRCLDPAANEPVYLVGGLAEVLEDRIEALIGRQFDAPQGDTLNGCFLIDTGHDAVILSVMGVIIGAWAG